MSKYLWIFILLLPSFLYGEDKVTSGILRIDVTVKVVNVDSEELWSVDFVKYTISNRGISINLKGFDGDLTATLNPVVIDDEKLRLETSCIIISLENKTTILESEKELLASFDEVVLFFPIGGKDDEPTVIMELKISKQGGVHL